MKIIKNIFISLSTYKFFNFCLLEDTQNGPKFIDGIVPTHDKNGNPTTKKKDQKKILSKVKHITLDNCTADTVLGYKLTPQSGLSFGFYKSIVQSDFRNHCAEIALDSLKPLPKKNGHFVSANEIIRVKTANLIPIQVDFHYEYPSDRKASHGVQTVIHEIDHLKKQANYYFQNKEILEGIAIDTETIQTETFQSETLTITNINQDIIDSALQFIATNYRTRNHPSKKLKKISAKRYTNPYFHCQRNHVPDTNYTDSFETYDLYALRPAAKGMESWLCNFLVNNVIQLFVQFRRDIIVFDSFFSQIIESYDFDFIDKQYRLYDYFISYQKTSRSHDEVKFRSTLSEEIRQYRGLITQYLRIIEDFKGVKKIIIPILSQHHWTSLVVDFESKEIVLRDRLNVRSPAERYLKLVREYLIMAQRELQMSQEIDFASFKLVKKISKY